MKIYSDKYHIYSQPLPCCEFEVLNELKDATNRTDANCLTHTRFLFEVDEIPHIPEKDLVDYQWNVIVTPIIPIIVRCVFSGSKSFHCIVELPKEWEEICRSNYKIIWNWFNTNYFDGLADKACANPSRLTRTPNVKRSNGNIQKLMVDTPDNIFNFPVMLKRLRRHIQSEQAKEYVLANIRKDIVPTIKNHDGMCLNYDVVARYLNTPFPNVKGNGHSSTWLFAAIKCCQKYGDNESLEKVLQKARNEHWSDKELTAIILK